MKKVLALFVVALGFAILVSFADRPLMPQPGGDEYNQTIPVPTPIINHDSIIRLHDRTTGLFFCSGVVVSDRLVITAGHCLGGRQPHGNDILVVSASKFASIASIVGTNERVDQGLITGDFRRFSKSPFLIQPREIVNIMLRPKSTIVACGFPLGGKLYCSPISNVSTFEFQFSGDGNLWPGMSGGPVIDIETGVVVAVNTAMLGSHVILSPLVELFSSIELSLAYGH